MSEEAASEEKPVEETPEEEPEEMTSEEKPEEKIEEEPSEEVFEEEEPFETGEEEVEEDEDLVREEIFHEAKRPNYHRLKPDSSLLER